MDDSQGNQIRGPLTANPLDGSFDSSLENWYFSASSLSLGTYRFRIIAWNSAARGIQNSIEVTIVSKPWASIVSPSGWLRNTVVLSATAGDLDGYVSYVRFIWTPDNVNGPFYLIGDDTNGADGWSINWNCGGPDNNDPSVWVVAVAIDNSGFESDRSWSNQFGVDQMAPSTPSLSSPTDGSSTTNTNPTFAWNPATDSLSGVASYTFQIDTSTSFGSGNLRTVSGIGAAAYTPSNALTTGTWYWWVKAVDNTGNEGSFSSYRSIIIVGGYKDQVIEGSSHTVMFVYPDTKGPKPPGVVAALETDWAAMGILIGVTKSQQYSTRDTQNSAPLYVDPSTGKPGASNTVIVAVGGPDVNSCVSYLEYGIKRSPVFYLAYSDQSGIHQAIVRRTDNKILSDQLTSVPVTSQDYFVIYTAADDSGNTYYVFWGIRWTGSLASSYKLLELVQNGQLSSQTGSYQVWEWQDTNVDGMVNEVGTDTYTLIASG